MLRIDDERAWRGSEWWLVNIESEIREAIGDRFGGVWWTSSEPGVPRLAVAIVRPLATDAIAAQRVVGDEQPVAVVESAFSAIELESVAARLFADQELRGHLFMVGVGVKDNRFTSEGQPAVLVRTDNPGLVADRCASLGISSAAISVQVGGPGHRR